LPLAPLLLGWSFFDPFHEHVEKGNALAEEGESAEALRNYEEAARVNPSSPIPDFNAGVVEAREGKREAARDSFLAAAASEDREIAADALYNLGNVLLEDGQVEAAVEAYLKSLDLDPVDPDARRNLEIAARRLMQNPPPPSSSDSQQRQQQEEKDQEEGSPKEQPKPPEETPPEDSRGESPPREEDSGREESPAPEELPPEERLSREDAERLLNAIASDELKVLQKLQPKEEEPAGVKYDW
jgi:tetratricopeptide (TPR) repeat protein